MQLCELSMTLNSVLSHLSDNSLTVMSRWQNPYLNIRRRNASMRPISTADKKTRPCTHAIHNTRQYIEYNSIEDYI